MRALIRELAWLAATSLLSRIRPSAVPPFIVRGEPEFAHPFDAWRDAAFGKEAA